MSHHVVIHLPDDRIACADYRDPAVPVMRKINRALAEYRPVEPGLYQRVAAWLDGHREQSAVCHAGLSPVGLPCGH